jgi:hypothetical protein
MVRVAIALVVMLLLPSAAWAQKRVALVIGNSAYQHTPKLTNPKNDATDVVAALKKHGFQVLEGFDLDKAAFDRKVRDFAVALSSAQVGVFFYAGHGLQVSGHNYLVPVDAQLSTASALDFEMVRLDLVHRTMEREAQTNILFLDACRDNPLARNLARAMGTRSTEVGRGLAIVESGVGTLISFSTQPGNVALDGAGRNSPFAESLVKHISTSSDGLSDILVSVRNDVMKETQRKQVPWEHSALTGRFYFHPTAAQSAPPAAAPPARQSEAAEAWAATKDSTNIAVLQAFIARYNDTFFAELARGRVEELKQQVAIATPAPAPPSPVKPQPSPAAPITGQRPVAKERSFRLTSSFPKSMTDVYAPSEQIVREIELTTSSKLKLGLFAAGEIVPGLQVLDAVQNGTVELGWTIGAYYFGKDLAFAAASGWVPLGIDATGFVRWMQGSGSGVRDQLFSAFGVKAFPCSIAGPKGLWLRKAVKSLDDMKGLKLRIGGATAQAMSSWA